MIEGYFYFCITMGKFNHSIISTLGRINFSFARIITPGGEKFFIQAANSKGHISSFEMKDRGGKKYTIVQPAPDWVIHIQNELNHVINSQQVNTHKYN